MAAGDILKVQNLVVEAFTVKTGESIEKGEICVVDSGLLAATSAHKGPYYMALIAHVYGTDSASQIIPCVKYGYVEAQAKPAAAIEKGDYLELSTTAGEVTLSDVTAQSDVVGVAEYAAATTVTTVKMTIGQMP